jgi:hypothetical protein
MSWRQGLYWYVGIGLALGAVALPMGLLRKRKDNLIDRLTDAMYPERRTAWYRFRERVLLPLLILPLMGLAWPIILVVLGIDALRNRAATKEAPEVTAADLLESIEVDAAEAGAYITDPLGAVPPVPFGHLNAAWQAFLTKRQPDEVLWRYQSHDARSWSGPEVRRGYVWVRGRRIGAFFRTYRKKEEQDRD